MPELLVNKAFFRLRKKKPLNTQKSIQPRPRTSTRYGGMQVRELQARMEIFLDEVLNRHRSVLEPAQALAEFCLIEQQKFLHSVDRISLINTEFAFQFCNLAIPALTVIEDSEWEPWVDSLLKTLSLKGIGASANSINEFRSYQQEKTPDLSSVAFTEVSRRLGVYLQALSGRTLKLATSTQSYTDTETLYLPTHINHFSSRDDNYRLYKALLVHQWAQTWFGTWSKDLNEKLKTFPDKNRALQLFHSLETLRLDACVERELPGLSREMAMFRTDSKEIHPLWSTAKVQLQQTGANVETSLGYLSQLYPLLPAPEVALYQGQLRTDRAASVITERSQRERSALRKELSALSQLMLKQTAGLTEPLSTTASGFSVAQPAAGESVNSPQTRLEYNGNAIVLPPQLQTLLNSITQDHAEIPQHYLNNIDSDDINTEPESSSEIPINDSPDRHQFCYHEWDHSRLRYRKNWCLLYEQSVIPIAGVFVQETLNKYRFLLKQLHRSFEAMRQQNLRLKREPFGDNIDIDSVVEAWVDTHNGLEASERLFIQTRRNKRNVAVMFMVDMSASTAGRINQVERESLILLCETLELLGDHYAIYGFSGRGHRHCQCFHIKDFDERYDDKVRGRIEGIQAQQHTRLGTAIRHLGTRLSQVEARTRLLITLSDGRPDDINGYRGQYGIEDTRKAVIEMRQLGLHPYCITIDTDAREYIRHMFGGNGFAIINQVDELPGKIANIYRRLTS